MTAGSKRFEPPGEAMHALALLLLAGLPAADKLGATLESETARIQRELRAMSDPDPDLKDSKDLIESFISHTSDALKARRYYLGLGRAEQGTSRLGWGPGGPRQSAGD